MSDANVDGPRPSREVSESAAPSLWGSLDDFSRDLWMRSVLNKYIVRSTPTKSLFHYTSPEAFWKMLDGGNIWLTNAAYLNDQEELTYPVRLANEILQEIHAAETNERVQAFLFQVSQSLVTHVAFKSWYIASFSTDGNLLSQWRAYCKTGGYSLGFNGRSLSELLSGPAFYAFSSVVYDENDQTAGIRGVIQRYVSAWHELREKYPTMESMQFNTRLALELLLALTEQLIFIKKLAFHEEQEWRVAKYRAGSDDLSFRERNGTLVPYLVADLRISGRLPLKEIYVSPLGEQELAHHSALEALRAKKYDDPEKLIREPGYRLRF